MIFQRIIKYVPTPDFKSKYPLIFETFSKMKASAALEDEQDEKFKESLAREINSLCKSDESLADIAKQLFPPFPKPEEEFFEFTLSAYRYFNASDNTRKFMGRFWKDVISEWSKPEQEEWLQYSSNLEAFNLHNTLDFSHEVFAKIPFNPERIYSWLKFVFPKIKNDYYQRGFSGCIEGICLNWPEIALEISLLMQTNSQDETLQSLAARMIALVRIAVSDKFHNLAKHLEDFESDLEHNQIQSKRALFVESWAYSADSPELNEQKAFSIKKDLDISRGSEFELWLFLLTQAVKADKSRWLWIYPELLKTSEEDLGKTNKFWIGFSALFGWTESSGDCEVKDSDWEALFFKLPPFTTEDDGMWKQIEILLCKAIETKPDEVVQLITQLAIHSGEHWIELLDSDRNSFEQLHYEFSSKKLDVKLVSALCFMPSRNGRRLGLTLFEKWKIQNLIPEDVENASVNKIELLALETTRFRIDPKNLAAIHAGLSFRMKECSKEIEVWYKEEVLIQALNTDEYRSSVKEIVEKDHYLQAIIKKAEDHIGLIIKAEASPALKMETPGYQRASMNANKHFMQSVTSGALEHSVFAKLSPTVHLPYGLNWRYLQGDGKFSAKTPLNKSSVSMEIPRLGFIIPEEMQTRRLFASIKINELDETERGYA